LGQGETGFLFSRDRRLIRRLNKRSFFSRKARREPLGVLRCRAFGSAAFALAVPSAPRPSPFKKGFVFALGDAAQFGHPR